MTAREFEMEAVHLSRTPKARATTAQTAPVIRTRHRRLHQHLVVLSVLVLLFRV